MAMRCIHLMTRVTSGRDEVEFRVEPRGSGLTVVIYTLIVIAMFVDKILLQRVPIRKLGLTGSEC